MRHAMTLAARGPRSRVNPQVGCVILSSAGEVLAEGWHRGAGTPHAEVDALSKLAPEQTRGATAVVTLEPCNHTGTTPPCAQALIDAGIAQVYFAAHDPNPVAAGGRDRLTAAGVAVTGGVLEKEANEFMFRWLTAAREQRPFVTVKWAASLDGRAAAADGTSQWITGTAARQHVHEQRAAHDAILVGTGTVLADDPSLTARGDGGELLPEQPIPVVIGERPIPADARLHAHPHELIQYTSRDLLGVLADLWRRGIRSVFLEGGPTLASAFLAAGLADELLVYIAPMLLGGDRLAVSDLGVETLSAARRLRIADVERLGEDILVRARVLDTPASGPFDQRKNDARDLLDQPESKESD
ncbi:MAG: bifunctional diaminohydroxyphosphoribosylaminopyrimidine deaminase/5-amino-6-(5-phosphoribosylamino)uracil reductase RibD [Cryobacterium sp.]|nr:bifunctional diaminohydroxyphosphoribosylaminopyrimidine deaminase/5-amino-6-(5-phosphoribosylamino)uracil reductase RibD [Cryobacterium sp.]